MGLILCIETATEVCSIAIHENGKLLACEESSKDYVHTAQITLMVQQCLNQAKVRINQLDAVAVSGGPAGSFTGLRVGTSVAKGIAYVAKLPLISIDSLLAQASTQFSAMGPGDLVLPTIDARRQEVYASVYKEDQTPVFQNMAIVLDQFDWSSLLKASGSIFLVGNGSEKAYQYLPREKVVLSGVKSSAKDLLSLSQKAFVSKNFVDLAYFSPNYIKPPNITKTRKKLL